MKNLNELRNNIDIIDKELINLFEKRMGIVNKIANYKINNNIPILNSDREKEVLKKNKQHIKNSYLEQYIEEFLIDIMNISKKYQKSIIDNKEGIKMNITKGIIDRFEGDYAIVEVEDKKTVDIKKSVLPSNAKEGDVIVYKENQYLIDVSATEALKKEIEKLCEDLWE